MRGQFVLNTNILRSMNALPEQQSGWPRPFQAVYAGRSASCRVGYHPYSPTACTKYDKE